MQSDDIRALIRAHRPTDPSVGYPDAVRRTVASYARECRAQGQQWTTISAVVGVSATTIQNWCKQKPEFLPVTLLEPEPESPILAVSTPAPAQGLVLHTPQGFRLEGLDLQQALVLLKALR
jgi:hypothetical protein